MNLVKWVKLKAAVEGEKAQKFAHMYFGYSKSDLCKYNITIKALPMLVCMKKYSTRGVS